jgi:hypothetical protein
MQRTAAFHHHGANPVFPQPARLFEPTAALDAALDLCDAHPSPSTLPLARVLGACPRFPRRLLRRLEEVHPRPRARVKPQVLEPRTPRWQRRGRGVGAARVMDPAWRRRTQAEEAPGPIDQEAVWQHGTRLLAAIARLLCSRLMGARDGALGAVMTNRGAAGGVAAWTASAGEASTGWGGPSPSRRARQASTRRQGASPQGRRVWRHTGQKTCIHGVALDWRLPNQRPWSSGVGFGWS